MSEEPVERKEIFVRYASGVRAILSSIIILGFTGMVTAQVQSESSLPSSGNLRLLIVMGAFAALGITLAVTSWLRGKRYEGQPIMVLDADGFWHRRLGKLIP